MTRAAITATSSPGRSAAGTNTPTAASAQAAASPMVTMAAWVPPRAVSVADEAGASSIRAAMAPQRTNQASRAQRPPVRDAGRAVAIRPDRGPEQDGEERIQDGRARRAGERIGHRAEDPAETFGEPPDRQRPYDRPGQRGPGRGPEHQPGRQRELDGREQRVRHDHMTRDQPAH